MGLKGSKLYRHVFVVASKTNKFLPFREHLLSGGSLDNVVYLESVSIPLNRFENDASILQCSLQYWFTFATGLLL